MRPLTLGVQVTEQPDMVRYFSAAWLAQSHRRPAPPRVVQPPRRPHVPCVVQPRPPAFGKGYLQPKSRAPRPVEPAESCAQDFSLRAPVPPSSCASPISEMSGYSSGYESEAASSSSGRLSVEEEEEEEEEKDAPQRRVRTKFSPEQISKLEKIFNKHRYLDTGERGKAAQRLHLTETQVRTWFQNRRMKLKRDFQDYLAPQMPPVLFQPLHPVHRYHSAAGPRPHYPAHGPAFYPAPAPQLVLQQQMHHHQHHPPPHLLIRTPRFY